MQHYSYWPVLICKLCNPYGTPTFKTEALHLVSNAPINVKPHHYIYGLRWGNVGICTLANYKQSHYEMPVFCWRDCILVSCDMYNDKSPLPRGR